MKNEFADESPTENAKMTELLAAAQLAERLKVRPSTVREWAKTGRIPEIRISAKVRRFHPAEVEAVLRQQEVSRA